MFKKKFKNSSTHYKDDEYELFDCQKYNKNSKVHNVKEAVVGYESNINEHRCDDSQEIEACHYK